MVGGVISWRYKETTYPAFKVIFFYCLLCIHSLHNTMFLVFSGIKYQKIWTAYVDYWWDQPSVCTSSCGRMLMAGGSTM